MTTPGRSRYLGWLDRPAPRPLTWLVIAGLLATPAFLWSDALRSPWLKLDDFVYLAGSRTGADLRANLLLPHNAHVVPLYRLLTAGVLLVSGSLASLPLATTLASYAALVLAMAGVGILVRRETGDGGWGMGAMAVVGLSSILDPTVAWYSAAQALWAGSATVAVLLALEQWKATGKAGWLVLGFGLAAMAPAIWSGGYVAGPAGSAYLLTSGSRAARRGAAAPILGGVVFLGLSLAATGGGLSGTGRVEGSMQPLVGLRHTAQAIPEILVLANLGIDGVTTDHQGLGLLALLTISWWWSRGRGGLSPLEAAGGTMAILGFGLAYTFRSNYRFDSLREIGWYQAIPQLGGVLFAAGWANHRRLSRGWSVSGPIRVASLLGVVASASLLAVIHAPRVERLFLASLPPMSPQEAVGLPSPELKRLWGRYVADERSARQTRYLGRLDRAGAIAESLGASRQAIRGAVELRAGPGMPEAIPGLDAAGLLARPDLGGSEIDPSRLRSRLEGLVSVEPIPPSPLFSSDRAPLRAGEP